MVASSSELLARLEGVNWQYGIHTQLQGRHTTLLVKYVVEDNAYALMLTDFSNTYFECLMGEQIEAHFARFNKTKLSHQQILFHIKELLKDLRTSNGLMFEKLTVECHTTRITIKASKVFMTLKFNWNFYVISTDQDVFYKHFSVPMLRGLIHYYALAKEQKQQQQQKEQIKDLTETKAVTTTTTIIKVENNSDNNSCNNTGNHNEQCPGLPSLGLANDVQLFACLTDNSLAELFR